MAGSWGDVQTYSDMISDIDVFCAELGNAYAMMFTAANTCSEIMGEDMAALKACKNVALSCKKYEEAAELAQKLKRALEEERQEIIEYLRELEDLDN